MKLTKEEKVRYNNLVLEAAKCEKCEGINMKKRSLNLYLSAKEIYAADPKLSDKIKRLMVLKPVSIILLSLGKNFRI
jgi:hypothetical protein